jgi:hypothetical protein
MPKMGFQRFLAFQPSLSCPVARPARSSSILRKKLAPDRRNLPTKITICVQKSGSARLGKTLVFPSMMQRDFLHNTIDIALLLHNLRSDPRITLRISLAAAINLGPNPGHGIDH